MDDGVRLVADVYGAAGAPPVILAHGGGQTRHAWGGTARALVEAGWQAIAYDHRGHGESGWSTGGDYSLDRLAEDLRALARSCSAPPVVIGASLGGLSAMVAQGESDEALFRAVVLVDIAPNMNRDGAMAVVRFMGQNVEEGFASLDEAADVIARYTGRPRRHNPAGLAKNLRLGDDGRYRWHWDPRFLDVTDDHTTTPERLMDAARNIRLPMLLVRGRMSDLVTEEVAREFLAAMPHVEFVDVADARHMVAGDRNDAFTGAVVSTLARWGFARESAAQASREVASQEGERPVPRELRR